MIAGRDRLNPPKARRLHSSGQNDMSIDPAMFEHHRSKTHPYLESNPGFLRNDDHRSHALNHGLQLAIQRNDRSWFPLQMFGECMTSTGVRLVDIGKRPPALGTGPHRPGPLLLTHG